MKDILLEGILYTEAKIALRKTIGDAPYRFLAVGYNALREQSAARNWRSDPIGQRSRSSLERLRDLYRSRRCFVIGNGPSLKQLDLRLLKDEITIGSNGLFLIFDEIGFVPTIYTIEDRLVAADRFREAGDIRGTTKIYPYDLSHVLADSSETIWLNFRRAYFGFPQFSKNLLDVCYWGGTVSFMNLQIAFWLGCPEIYMIGFDHNYSIPKDAAVSGTVITSQSDDINHFHPDYFGKGYRWHDPQVERMEAGYRAALAPFAEAGRKIFNATAGGHLEVFPRVSYERLF